MVLRTLTLWVMSKSGSHVWRTSIAPSAREGDCRPEGLLESWLVIARAVLTPSSDHLKVHETMIQKFKQEVVFTELVPADQRLGRPLGQLCSDPTDAADSRVLPTFTPIHKGGPS